MDVGELGLTKNLTIVCSLNYRSLATTQDCDIVTQYLVYSSVCVCVCVTIIGSTSTRSTLRYPLFWPAAAPCAKTIKPFGE